MGSLRICALIVATSSGCAAMIQDWADGHCNYQAAYADGATARQRRKVVKTEKYVDYCPAQTRDLALRGLRDGYAAAAAAQAQAEAQAAEQARAAWAAANCSYDAAYAQGINVERAGGRLDPSNYVPCPDELREGAMRGYRQGYEAAMREPQAPGVVVAPPPIVVPSGPPNPRAYYCWVIAFMNKYDAFGPTQLEAQQAAVASCARSNVEMACHDVSCTLNR